MPLPRRTFAIISHPDAGKTTLTEKFLLYGGAVQLAGSVTARKNQRSTSSDWMALERQRGISVSSTVMQFEYGGYSINLLDTPGHQDFSEDTYRVLTAVDSVVMVIDAAKGIEPQTRKLFEVCRRRGIPIFTFVNKLDRPARDPIELLDELESVLGLRPHAMNWPLGNGPEFRGVYDRASRQAHLFERTVHGAYVAPVQTSGLDDDGLRSRLGDLDLDAIREEVAMLDEAGHPFDADAVAQGLVSPVFFGSAMNNFGVALLLDGFLAHASPPRARRAVSEDGSGRVVEPSDAPFSGFVFKMQANMDPRHRDRIAFVRIVSGRFERDMPAIHAQSGRRLKLSSAQTFFGQTRETVDEAWPGDIIGIIGHDRLAIGDTLTEDRGIVYNEIPRFAPECFAFLHNPQPSNFKRFREGLEQLLNEGVVHALEIPHSSRKTPLLSAVGPLQFDVVQFRMESEYNAPSRLERAPWTFARWCVPESIAKLDEATFPDGAVIAYDALRDPMILFSDEWALRFFQNRNPSIELLELPPREAATAQ